MDRQRLYGAAGSPKNSPSKSGLASIEGDSTPFKDLVHPSKSPRFLKADKLNIKDIRGTQANTSPKQKLFQVRDNINVTDILEEARPFKPQQVINKNEHLLTDDVLGRKKLYVKDHSPLEPQYIMSTKSRRIMMIGEVEGGKPKQLVRNNLRKDTKRILRVDDIIGASTKVTDVIPEALLPELHPMFQDRELVPKETKERGIALKKQGQASSLMQEVLKREAAPEKPDSDIRSRYKQMHQKWMNTKENSGYKATDESPLKQNSS